MTGVFVGLICALTWATGSIMMKDLSQKLDPVTLNAPRTLIGGLAMLALTFATGRNAGYGAVTPLQLFFMLGSMGVGGGIGDAFYVSSLARIGVSRAFPIASIYPALTLLLGLLLLSETLTLGVVAGLVFVTIGVVTISRMSASHAVVHDDASRQGITFALGAAVCWAVSMLMIAPGIQGLDAILVASIRVPALSLVLWAIVMIRGSWRSLLTLDLNEWLILLGGGFIGWGLGSMMFVLTVSMIGPTQAAIITSTSPMFALPLSAIFLRERLNRGVLLGTLMTICGVILVS